jgi:hypothetical protein
MSIDRFGARAQENRQLRSVMPPATAPVQRWKSTP